MVEVYIDWEANDPDNPYNWTARKKWLITLQLALTTFSASFGSSAYTGGLSEIAKEFNVSLDVAVLGVSLYVLGFALGPLVFAPLGETFGRRIVFIYTLSAFTLFQIGGSLGRNLPTVLACRLLSGIAGSSPLTNGGGVISDIWLPRDRAAATGVYSMVTFLGPVVGPIVGGFVVENPRLDWHFNFWVMFILGAIALISGVLISPETYAPVLLRWRAAAKTRACTDGTTYVSVYDIARPTSFRVVIRLALSRPFRFLAKEPIVTMLSCYIAFVYGTMYGFFAVFPIVFQEHRHFDTGDGGLAFLGLGLGVIIGTSLTPVQNRIFWRAMDASPNGRAAPEERLHMTMIGGVLVPVGLFWFAWTAQPSVHWIAPVLAATPFGIGLATILQGLTAYLMDTYGAFYASAAAAAVLLRSLGGAAFPLITPSIYGKLGDNWGTSVFAFISLSMMPIPLLFYRYGKWIRSKSKFAYHEESTTQCDTPRTSTMLSGQSTPTVTQKTRSLDLKT